MNRFAILTVCITLGLSIAAPPAGAGTYSDEVRNPTNRAYEDALVRLKVDLPTPFDATGLVVRKDGEQVPYQVEVIEGEPGAVEKGHIWVAPTLESGQTARYEVTLDGDPQDFDARAQGKDRGNGHVQLENDKAVRIGFEDGELSFTAEGVSVMADRWQTDMTETSAEAELLASGPLFSRMAVRYQFDGKAGLDRDTPAYAETLITLPAGKPYALIHQSHTMHRDDHQIWRIEGVDRSLDKGLMRRWYDAQFSAAPGIEEFDLEPGYTRLGETFIKLQPRWSQGYDHGWFFGATDGDHLAGALALRAGKWHFPHDNHVQPGVEQTDGAAHLKLPTFRGERYWALVLGGRQLADDALSLAEFEGFAPLDKLHNEYILEWEGADDSTFGVANFYSNNTNPTAMLRGWARNAVRDARAGQTRNNLRTLYDVQARMDPDWFGDYDSHWSPINPNFYTDFMKYPLARLVTLRNHPRFDELAERAEKIMRDDFEHTVTLPGGAGNEAPGYHEYAMKEWAELAPLLREHMGFDITEWERWEEGARFLLRISQPEGEGSRNFNPAGDTHPGRPDPFDVARRHGVRENARDWKTEEFPGFGVIFRHNSGTADETYLSFKAGPNRGHYHGDQLAFHYAHNARKRVIDHHVGYSPRPGQEHMHNRLAFFNDRFEWANMDGHERLIAFETSDVADVAIGQVDSERLREQKKMPPEDWDARGPLEHFDQDIRYRRTIVQFKGGAGEDYFIFRDQYEGPTLGVRFCIHVLADRMQRRDDAVHFDDDRIRLFIASPREWELDSLPFEHDREGGESTQGALLTTEGDNVEFITVMYPGGDARFERIEDGRGVRVTIGEQVDEVTFHHGLVHQDDQPGDADRPVVTARRNGEQVLSLTADAIDMQRHQGDVGLFVPDVGYPFGPLPDWLIRQRTEGY